MRILQIRPLLLITSCIAGTLICRAQQATTAAVALIGRSYNDHITLRFFATKPSLFNTANTTGYVVERALWKEKTPVAQLSFQPLKTSPVKRWPEAQWEAAVKTLAPADTAELKLVALAMGLSDPEHPGAQPDILSNDLQSLKKQQEEADNRFAYMLIAASRSKIAAEGLGLRIEDHEVKTGTRYVYRVRINTTSESAGGWTYLTIDCAPFTRLPFADTSLKVTTADHAVSFTFPESRDYFAFDVERSDDGGKTFKRITDQPAFKIKPAGYKGSTTHGYSDSGLMNDKKYVYRIIVATPFADQLLLTEFTATPKDRTAPAAPFLKSATHVAPGEVLISWELPSASADLKGFFVSRGNAQEGPFKRISSQMIAASARSYTDKNFDAEGLNYYVVEAVDTAGNSSRSFAGYVTLIDSTPPAAPLVDKAVIDSLGKVTIRLRPNKEKDFMGYQLLKANAADHEFSVVQETYRDSLGRSTFVLYDSTTLKTLSKSIFYQLIAFDTHFNQSAPSRIIELTRRDTIPPVSPQITDYAINDSSVILRFVNSPSEDVKRNILLRKLAGSAAFDSIFINKDTSVTAFTDRKVQPGVKYEYAMVAVDGSGLISRLSNAVVVKTLPASRMPAPVITIDIDKEKKAATVKITIDKKLDAAKLKIEVYRRKGNQQWELVKTLDASQERAYTEKGWNPEADVHYAVRLVDARGQYSVFSNDVSAKM